MGTAAADPSNVETYRFPEDVVQDNLGIKIVEKTQLLQLVKYCASQQASRWRLSVDAVAGDKTLTRKK